MINPDKGGSFCTTTKTSNSLLFRTTLGLLTCEPYIFHVSLHIVLYSNSAINSTKFGHKSFLCRPNGSQLKLHQKIAGVTISHLSKVPS